MAKNTQAKRNNRNRKRGKDMERSVAKYLGWRRVGIMGDHDVEGDGFAGECKSVASSVLDTYFKQAEANAKKVGLNPVVFVRVAGGGRYHRDNYAVVRMSLFAELVNDAQVARKQLQKRLAYSTTTLSSKPRR